MSRIGYSLGSSFIGALVLAGSLGTANAATIKGFDGLPGECLDVNTGVISAGQKVIAWPCHGGPNQEWVVNDGQIRVKSNPGLCLDVFGANPADGTQIIIWPCKPPFTAAAANQKWSVINGRIRGLANKCLDIEGANTNPGTDVILWPCKPGNAINTLNQRWTVE